MNGISYTRAVITVVIYLIRIEETPVRFRHGPPRMKKHGIAHYLLTFLFVFVKSLLGAIFWIILTGVGLFIFQLKKSPYDLIVGLPLLLVGAGLTLNSFLSVFNAIFSFKYNQGMCPICSKK